MLATPALAAPDARPVIAPPPDWVLPAAMPAAPTAIEGASVVDLLLDQQVRLIDGGVATYRANVYRIASSQGLDAGALQLNWDPSLETLTIHRYRILREGKVIDLVGTGAKLQVVQREKNLENATLDGELTASQQPEDLRAGDVIDLAYTIVRKDPATGGRAEGLYGPQDGVPYGRYRLRVTWPKGRTVQWRAAPGVVVPHLSEKGGESELLSDLANVTTPRPPSGAPAHYGMVNLVDLTEFPDWPSVSRAYAGLFAKAVAIAPDSPLKGEIARIAAASPDPVRRAELALALVEEQVRYLFIGMDDGGFVPAPADQTWQRRYGDCKGKTALLIALLSGLGIEARPVLVNTDDGDATAHRLPTMAGFDHVIVEATIAGRSYWLDGTRQGDTRLDRLVMPDMVVGLPATATGSGLIPMIEPTPTVPESLTSLALDASQGIEVPAPATGEMRFRGDQAAQVRMKYAGYSSTDLERVLKKLWRDTYDFVTPDEVAAREEKDSGEFVISMKGKAKMDWYMSGSTRWYELDRARVGWKIKVERDGELNPDAPFAFDYPAWWANRETIVLPQKGTGFALQAKDIDRTVGDLYAFHRKVAITDGVLRMENDTRALKDELPATQAVSVRDEMQALANDGVFVRVPDNYLYTPADLVALAEDKPALAKAYVQNGAVRLDQADTAGSIADEKQAIAIDPKLSMAHAVLALAYSRTGKDDEAALHEADLVTDAKSWLPWAARGGVFLRRTDFAGAVAAYDKVLATNRNDVSALVGRGSAHLGLGHSAQALADFDAALAIMPKLPLEAARAVALAGVGRREEALDQADIAIARSPDDRPTRLLRINVRYQTGDSTGALADADYLLAHKPTAQDYLLHAHLLPDTDTARREADIDAALKLDGKNAEAYLLRAQGAIATGRLALADTALEEAEKRKANALAVTSLRLDLLAKRGDASAALKLANEAVSSHPDDASTRNMVCWFKATRNIALDTALADCDAAVKLAANTPSYLDSRAFARLRGGDTKGAITDYSAALHQSPDLVASLYGRGIAYARLGDRNRALADLSRARADKPDIDTVWADYGVTPPPGF